MEQDIYNSNTSDKFCICSQINLMAAAFNIIEKTENNLKPLNDRKS